MRLTPVQRNAILDAIHGEAGPAVRVLLFGSRVADNAVQLAALVRIEL